jgi:dTDP-4-dehydrorhamnose 3,5-epimerase
MTGKKQQQTGFISMIDGVFIHTLRQIPDERGKIMHMLRVDDPHFEQFGEIYFSVIYPGVVKGWHLHQKMTLNYAVISGMIKLVLYDDRPASPTHQEVQELFLGEANYALVRIPPGIWNGFKGIGTTPAIVANCATLPHDPAEISRMDPFDNPIPYDWSLKHR